MRLAVLSDIHLEFGRFNLKVPTEVDAILLPGDICTPHIAANTGYGEEYRLYKRFHKFFKECNQVAPTYYVLGNHEHYHGRLESTIPKLQDIIGDTIVLDGTSCALGGYALWGGTLWTDLKSSDPLVEFHVTTSMNDFTYAKGLTLNRHRSLNTDYTLRLREFLSNNDNPIVMTHHAPHTKSIPQQYQADILSYAYANTELEYLLLDNDILWFHGHTHHSQDYYINNSRIICNPRGYPSEKNSNDFLILDLPDPKSQKSW